jgi:hypothetical protein
MEYRLEWLAVLGLAAASCTAAHPARSRGTPTRCTTTTIDQLWRNPPQFEGRRICVSGFLGRMVPFGEASPELFSTRAEAESTYSDRRIVLGLPFTLRVQERLSRYSLQPLQVEGVFQLESPCLPVAAPAQRNTVCDPPPEMRIAGARLTFAEGARFR